MSSIKKCESCPFRLAVYTIAISTKAIFVFGLFIIFLQETGAEVFTKFNEGGFVPLSQERQIESVSCPVAGIKSINVGF